jgi:trehalose-6-phosphate synthase
LPLSAERDNSNHPLVRHYEEFVAAQDPADPGVLVLSSFAGAAEQLDEALLVNPHDIQGMAAALHQALTMPLEERRSRHNALARRVVADDVESWRERFLRRLADAAKSRERTVPRAGGAVIFEQAQPLKRGTLSLRNQ